MTIRIRRKRPRTWRPEVLPRLGDEDFVQLCATAVADRTDLRQGDLVIGNRIKRGTPPEAMDMLFAEMARRNIHPSIIAERVTSEAMAGHSFISHLVAPTSWKRYEIKAAHAIRAILKAQGAPVDHYEFDARIVGKITGQERQVDLLLIQYQPKHVVACEFRDYEERFMPVEKVEAFATKLDDIDVDKGVIVTPCGYQRGAIATARHHGIELFRLRHVPAAEIRARYPDRVDDLCDSAPCWLLEDQHGQSWVFEES
jgi:hypothetical protein